ncbi:hypothetical protein JXA84_07285 [candidate division WOR-3 bacterium]|nr:hypothetical protein [candidate division WOR-3 bacterium]
MKKNFDPRELALFFLKDSARRNLGSDLFFSEELSSLGKKDRAFCFNLVLTTVRNYIFLDHALSKHLKKISDLPQEILWILRLGASQIIFFSSVPDYAAVDTSVELAKKAENKKFAGLVNAVMRKTAKDENVLPEGEDPASLSLRHSVPLWLIGKWNRDFGDMRTSGILEFFSSRQPICFSVIDPAQTEKIVSEATKQGFKISPAHFSKKCFYSDRSLIYSRFFKEGSITVQDESSELVEEVFDFPLLGTVFDLCCAPGGKTVSISTESSYTCACDIELAKMKSVLENSRRIGISEKISLCVSDAVHPPFRENSADLVIADVPCSGTGTLHKNPDIKLKLKKTSFRNIASLQFKILSSASKLVKRKGLLLYSTCSLEKEENHEVVQRFLKDSCEFSVVRPKKEFSAFSDENGFCIFTPDIHGISGSFAALMKRDCL